MAGRGGGSRGHTLAKGGLITLVHILSLANGRWAGGGGGGLEEESDGENRKKGGVARIDDKDDKGLSDERREKVRRGSGGERKGK